MSANTDPMVSQLAIDAEEQAELMSLVERELGETRVEARRTHNPNFRDEVLHHEAVLRRLLEKLNRLRP
jgi:hypothetical protein